MPGSGNAAINSRMGVAEWALLFALSLLWGGSFFFSHLALQAMAPFTLVALRVGVAAVILNLCLLASGRRLPFDRAAWAAFIGMGFLNNAVPFSLLAFGQTEISSGLTAILNATTPLFTVIVADRLTEDEKLTGGRLVGVVIGFAGVATMMGPTALHGAGATTLGELAVLGAALFYAFGGVFGRRFRGMGLPPMIAATGMLTASALMLIPVALVVDRPWTLAMPGWPAAASVVAIATLSTAIAFLIYFRLLATAGATNLLLVTFLVPAWAVLLGAVVLGERFGLSHAAGMALIAAGLVAIDGRGYGAIRRAMARPPRARRGSS